MAEAVVFQREWVVQMNDMLDIDNDVESRRPNEDESRLPNEHAILRVAAPLRKMKPEAYIPQFVSLGPYHHSILEKDTDSSCPEHKISTAETCKGKAAASLSENLRGIGKSFNSIVESMKQIRPEIDRFYHWPTGSSTTEDQEHSKNFALMMAVDSAFLLHFLSSLYESRNEASSSLELGPLRECIKSDILKLENQIPLFVMKKVFENAEEPGITRKIQLLHKTCPELSPFELLAEDVQLFFNDNDPYEQPHLLGYLHAVVSPTLQIERETKRPTILQLLKIIILDIPLVLASILVIPTLFFERKYEIALQAEKLAKAGIKFKLLSRATEKIRFERWSGTLYLPRIKVFEMQTEVLLAGIERKYEMALSAEKLAKAGIIFKLLSHVTEKIRFESWSGTLYLPEINVCEMHTEVLLRNMIALEFNDVARGTNVMRYIGLMDSLIQTPDDVRVLRDHRVIATDTVTDESIVKMWNDLAQPFFTGQFNLARHSDDLIGRELSLVLMLGELYDYVSSWKFIGFVAAFLGLFLTAVQTYFTVCSYFTVSPSFLRCPSKN